MNVTRRGFLKLASVAGAAALAPLSTSGVAMAARPAADDAVGMLVDTTLCAGCRACEAACSEANHLAAPAMAGERTVFDTPRKTSSTAFTVVNRYENPRDRSPRFVKTQCMHCVEPGCASACPAKALVKTAEGPVVYHGDRCIGCRYCMVACPFGIPKYEYEKAMPLVRKCGFCADRQKNGLGPACAEVCPTGAITFGKRADLLEMAKTRIYQKPDAYVHHVYGEHEAGGTGWLYVSDVPFETLGFKDVGTTPYPEYTRTALSLVPMVLMIGPPLLMGLYSFSRARENAAAGDVEEARHD